MRVAKLRKVHNMAAGEKKFICDNMHCPKDAISFCVNCTHLFCDEHEKAHHDIFTGHETIDIGTYSLNEAKYRQTLCQWHREPQSALCSRCHAIFCNVCVGENLAGCTTAETEEGTSDAAHKIISLDAEAHRIRLILIDLQSMLHVTVHGMNEALKKLHRKTDSIQEKSRDMLDEITQTVESMKMKLDCLAEDLREEVKSHMNFTRLQVDEVETNVQEFSDRSDQLVQNTSALLEGSKVDIISNYRTQETEFNELIRTRFPDAAFVTKIIVRPEQDLSFLALVEKPSVPEAIQYQSTLAVPDECYTLTYLPDGTLVHAGKYALTGANTDDLPLPGRIDFMYSYSERLYMISIGESRNSFLHMLNLSDNVLKTNILSAPADQHFRRMAATDHYILITEYGREVIHVYSTANFSHQFDMKVNFHPSSIVPLPTGELVLTDSAKRAVVCVTLHMESEVVWETVTPTAPGVACLDQDENFIYVSSCTKAELYMISLQGLLVQTLRIPEFNGRVHDFCVSDQSVALFGTQDFSQNIKLYDLMFHQPM